MESTRNFSNCSLLMSPDTINTLDKYYSKLEQKQFGFWSKAGKAALVAGGVLGAAYLGDHYLNNGELLNQLKESHSNAQFNDQIEANERLADKYEAMGNTKGAEELRAQNTILRNTHKENEATAAHAKQVADVTAEGRANPLVQRMVHDKTVEQNDATRAKYAKDNAVRNAALAKGEKDYNSALERENGTLSGWVKNHLRDTWIGRVAGAKSSDERHKMHMDPIHKKHPEVKMGHLNTEEETFDNEFGIYSSAIPELQGIVRHFSDNHPEVQLFSLTTIADLMYSGSIQDKHFNNFRKKYNF